MNRFSSALVLAAAFLAGAVIAAVPQTPYQAFAPLTAESLQGDFQEIEARLAAVEANAGGAVSYPTDMAEHNTGTTWLDTKPIYRKVVPVTGPNGSIGTPGVVSIAHGVVFEEVVRIYGGLKREVATSPGTYNWKALPMVSATDTWRQIDVSVQPTVIEMQAQLNWSDFAGYIVIEYTKP